MKLLLTVLMIAQVSIAQSFSSGGMGNGGHPYEIQFKKDIKYIISLFERKNIDVPEGLASINLYTLKLNSEVVEIEVKRRTLKDKFGRIKSALNFPGRRLIQINKKDWERIKDNESIRLPLVLHEYLGISGEEIDNYNISSELYSFVTRSREVDSENFEDHLSNVEDEKLKEKLSKLYIRQADITERLRSENPTFSLFVEIGTLELERFYETKLKSFYQIDSLLVRQMCIDMGFFINLGVGYSQTEVSGYQLTTRLSIADLKELYKQDARVAFYREIVYDKVANKKPLITKIYCGK